jgi:hypothetical protein
LCQISSISSLSGQCPDDVSGACNVTDGSFDDSFDVSGGCNVIDSGGCTGCSATENGSGLFGSIGCTELGEGITRTGGVTEVDFGVELAEN